MSSNVPRGYLNNRQSRVSVTRKNTSLPPNRGLVDTLNFSGTVGVSRSIFKGVFSRSTVIETLNSRYQNYNVPSFSGQNYPSISSTTFTRANNSVPSLSSQGLIAFSFSSLAPNKQELTNNGRDITIFDKTNSSSQHTQTRFGSLIQGIYGAFNNLPQPAYSSPYYIETDEPYLFSPLQGVVAYKTLFPSANYRLSYYPYGVNPNTPFQSFYPSGYPLSGTSYIFSSTIRPIFITEQELKMPLNGVRLQSLNKSNGLMQGRAIVNNLPAQTRNYYMHFRLGETFVKVVYGRTLSFMEKVLVNQYINRESRVPISM